MLYWLINSYIVFSLVRVFPILWTLVCPLIDETSRGKFMFYAGDHFLGPGGLNEYLPEDKIPDWLGGPSATGERDIRDMLHKPTFITILYN